MSRCAQYPWLRQCALIGLAVLFAGSVTAPSIAQVATPAPVSAAAAGTASAEPTLKPESEMTRDERIKAHREKIEKILAAEKQRREDEAKKAAAAVQAAQATPAPPGTAVMTPAGVPGFPGGAGTLNLPASPGIQPAIPGAVPTPTPPGGAPTGSRSESRSMLFLYPFDSTVSVGDTFQTEVVADTKRGTATGVSFLLRYPKEILNPLAIDHTPLDSLARGEITFGNDPEKGEIYIAADFKEATNLPGRPLAIITWEAVAADPRAQIRFVSTSDLQTALYFDKQNVLGTEAGAGTDGVLQGSVNVRSRNSRPIVQKLGEKELIIAQRDVAPPPPSISLSIDSPAREVRVGEEFTVDVRLENPNGAPFDRVSLYLQFDPAVLEVVDADRNNGIRTGINMEAGFTKHRFPFDFFLDNTVDNKAGTVSYRVGSANVALRSSGVIGRVHFRAKTTAARTDIVLAHNEPGYVPTTDVTYLESSVMVGAPRGLGAISGVAVAVLPGLPAANAEIDVAAISDQNIGIAPAQSAARGVSLTESGLGKNRRITGSIK